MAGETDVIRGWHAHVYFDATTRERARMVAGTAAKRFDAPMGRMHDRPVGPHPSPSVQLEIAPERIGQALSWFVLNRRGLTIFVHAETGDHLADHTEHVVWLGESRLLDLSIFGS